MTSPLIPEIPEGVGSLAVHFTQELLKTANRSSVQSQRFRLVAEFSDDCDKDGEGIDVEVRLTRIPGGLDYALRIEATTRHRNPDYLLSVALARHVTKVLELSYTSGHNAFDAPVEPTP